MSDSALHSDRISESIPELTPSGEWKPIAKSERIEALDVVRGFALIGIFLMNIEFFNRVVSDIGQGMPAGLKGLDWGASYFIAYFVTGKFWTIFSLLFGMGFAVMLTRSEAKGQKFIIPYLRRIVALAIFGTAHHILIWPGDILFSYAVAALGLVIVLFMPAKWWLAALIVSIGLMAAWQNQVTSGVMVMLVMTGLFMFFMRSEAGLSIRGKKIHGLAWIFFVIGLIMTATTVVGFAVPGQAKLKGFLIAAIAAYVMGFLIAKYHQPEEKRSLRLGATAYLLLFISMAVGTASQTWDWGGHLAKQKEVLAAMKDFDPSKVTESELKALREKKNKTELEEAKLAAAENTASLTRKAKRDAEEVKILSHGTYVEAVKLRAQHFARHAPNEFNTCALFIAMFLMGYWFVRSGIIERAEEHLPMFRKLAFIGLPLGIGLGVLGSYFGVSADPHNPADAFYFGESLLYIGNLPACIGYVSLMIVFLHSKGPFSKVKVLAPYGRMALTNYLSQSIICSAIFYSYGLGLYGMPRAQQVLVVVVVVSLQVMFSHWWLSKFLYGPMEWLWRAITYWKVPKFRVVPD